MSAADDIEATAGEGATVGERGTVGDEGATADEKPDFMLDKLPNDSTELPPHIAAKRRIKYVDDDDNGRERVPPAAPYGSRPNLHRQGSNYSIHSVQSARRSVRGIDPSVLLPIGYRTISYNIEDGERMKQKKLALKKEMNEVKAKAKAKVKGKKKSKDAATDEISEARWHIMTHEELYKHFATNTSTGLSTAGVKDKVAQYGRNVPSKPPSHLAQKIFWYFFGGFGSILLIGSILVWICWRPLGEPDPSVANLALAIVLLVVFFIQAAFNAWQDFSSSRVMNSITGMLPEDCYVLRDGTEQMCQAPDVVPGDILFFKSGNKLPADVRFIEVSTDAKFDRSILTGESLPLAAVRDSTDANYMETRCIGMQGTTCTSGSGKGIVVSTGDSTVFGHIAKLTSTPNTESTPLQKEVLRFVLIIVGLMITMDIIIVGVWCGYIRKKHPGYINTAGFIVDLVSVAIAFVPEGLPIALTASLTIIANIMRQNNILCKSLKTVETLGAVSVLLSDKTGTLTKNLMVVTDVAIGLTTMTMSEAIDEYGEGKPPPAGTRKLAIDQLRTVAAVCNAGQFDPTTKHLPLEDRRIIADATDQAILRMSETLAPVSTARGMWRTRFDLAFNSKNKFAIRVVSATEPEAPTIALSEHEAGSFREDKDFVLYIKGAPDVLIGKCGSYVGEDGNVYNFDESIRASIDNVKDSWSRQGKRVLLLARKCLTAEHIQHDPSHGDFEEEALKHAQENLILVGLVGIVDPPREEIPEVVNTLRTAGVRTMMVTGDFKLTAQAIARMCSIITVPDNEVDSVENLPKDGDSDDEKYGSSASLTTVHGRIALVLSGAELNTLGPAQWEAVTQYREIVFARTTPDQKLRIVKEFRARENIVAMTGDGVNDAPSLKEADIGIAPGTGSDIAIEASDMVLLDSFSAIVQAVLYGRVVYDNLKKTIAYLLPAGSFSEFWPVMTSVIFGLPQVLCSFLMIIICCFTDCAAATTLAYEKPEADVLLRPPRNVKKDKLVDLSLLGQSYGLFGIIETVCSFSMSYWYLQRHGVPFSKLWWSFGNPDLHMSEEQYQQHLNTASSIYFITLVVMQWFTLMAIRTRRLSIFQHPPLFNKATQNWLLFPAILFALGIAFIFNYIPGLQSKIETADIPVEHWFLPFAFGFGVLCIDELRKAAARRWPKSLIAKISW